jgi:nicotinamidase-related amidase
MNSPKTLLQMAGADPKPAPLRASVLVIIDAQYEYLDGRLALPGIEPALQALVRLLERARKAGAPVIHVAHRGRPGGLFDRGAHGGAIIEAVAPAAGERIVEKPLPNAFAQTELKGVLEDLGQRSLLLAGFMTHMCVSSTARAALDLGFATVVAADAAATRDLPDPLGGAPIAADQVHRAALAALADRFAVVTTVDRIPAG